MVPAKALRGTLASLCLCLAAPRFASADGPLPVVLWHGMGDNAVNPMSMGAVKTRIEQALPGTYVYSVMVGQTPEEDTQHGYFGNVNDQVQQVCAAIAADPQLAGGYNAVGFSQGGQFLRAVAQRCPSPPMRTLVTMGGQHQGIAALPGCNVSSADAGSCLKASAFVAKDAYGPWVNTHVVQAQYFKDPNQLDRYLARNPFLPDINNEGEKRNPKYAANLRALSRLVLFMFENDATVQPKESSWFGFWDGDTIVPLQQQRIYREDWLGLKALDKAGKLVTAVVPGAAHMQFTLDWFEQNVIAPYLSGGDVVVAEGAAKHQEDQGPAAEGEARGDGEWGLRPGGGAGGAGAATVRRLLLLR